MMTGSYKITKPGPSGTGLNSAHGRISQPYDSSQTMETVEPLGQPMPG